MRYLVLVIFLFVSACKEQEVKPGESVGIYLLKSPQDVGGSCRVDASAAVLQDSPAAGNEDIVAYSQSDYQFELTNAAFRKIQALQDGTPFAVTVDGRVIYYGLAKPGFSSSACPKSIIMDAFWAPGNKIFLKLGHPGAAKDSGIDDQRNNPKLLATLRNQGKLR